MGNQKQRAELRADMKKVMASLDPRWIQAASHDLCRRLSQLLDKNTERSISKVLAWIPHFPGEVDLGSFISEQLGKREVYLPRVLPQRAMNFVRIEKNWSEHMEPGFHGVRGPSEGGKLFTSDDAENAVVIVPGLAFDGEGSRLGRGDGYYATFLRPPMSNALTIGVGWSLQIVPQLPPDRDQLVMDWICTEREALHTGLEVDEDFV